jgi:hypothetical protein
MKYAVEMGSGAMVYIPSFIKIGSGIQEFIGGKHRQRGDRISLRFFFQNVESGLKLPPLDSILSQMNQVDIPKTVFARSISSFHVCLRFPVKTSIQVSVSECSMSHCRNVTRLVHLIFILNTFLKYLASQRRGQRDFMSESLSAK